jgi:hypothetical protein
VLIFKDGSKNAFMWNLGKSLIMKDVPLEVSGTFLDV